MFSFPRDIIVSHFKIVPAFDPVIYVSEVSTPKK